ncbi:MAG: RluA family pseudouridine synthase [Deinococcales bacterium]
MSHYYQHSTEGVWLERLTKKEIFLDGKPATALETLSPGQKLIWQRPPWQEDPVPRYFELIYQDEDILVVNKPSGLPTMPAGGFLENTLLYLLRESYPELSPVHRLGRGTSGLVIFARHSKAAQVLSQAWQDGVEKFFQALASEVANEAFYDIRAKIGLVDHPRLGKVYAASDKGKSARSLAQVSGMQAQQTLFEVSLKSGRPHQIRIHLAYIGHPLVGDPLYDKGGVLLPSPGLPGDGGYCLHAAFLKFRQPSSGKFLELHAPLVTAH